MCVIFEGVGEFEGREKLGEVGGQALVYVDLWERAPGQMDEIEFWENPGADSRGRSEGVRNVGPRAGTN